MPTRPTPNDAGRAIVTIAALLPLVAASYGLLAPPRSGMVAAIFPPWWTATRIFASAASAGRVVRTGALPFIVVVAALDRQRIRKAGAWLLLDPRAVGGCDVSGASRQGETES